MEDKKIHILFTIPNLGKGGAEGVVINILKYLDREKFKISLGVADYDDSRDIPEDIIVYNFKTKKVRHATFRYLKLIKELKPDIVFSNISHLNLLIGFIKIFISNKIKFVARESFIVSENIKDFRLRRIWVLAYWLLYPSYDKVIYQTTHMLKDFEQILGIKKINSTIIYNPLDLNNISKLAQDKLNIYEIFNNYNPNTDIILVAAGRLAKEKGFDLLINAIKLIDNVKFKLIILGEGSERAKLTSLIEQNFLDHQIKLIGHVANPYKYFKNADAFILSSLHEGLPNVVLESLACGTPVISTPSIGGTLEILASMKSCSISDQLNAESLAQTISKYNFRKEKIYEDLNKYEINKIIKEYENLFLNL